MHKWDVIIAGAGPAGAMLGYELGRRGIEALILEKDALPRYKPCGGGVNVKAVRHIGFDIDPVVECTVTGARLTYRMGNTFTRTCPRPLTLTTSRDRFDHFLVQKAQETGCTVHEREPVQGIELHPDRVIVHSSRARYAAALVAGADGANSTVARAAGLLSDRFLGVGIESEVEVAPADLEAWQAFVLIDLASLKNGYGWIFPKRDHLSIGVWGPAASSKGIRAYYQRFMAHCASRMARFRVLSKKGHCLPTRDKGAPIQKGRLLLVGDAAGLVEPLTGEGIYYAVRSAQMAAQATADHLGDPQRHPLATYQAAVDATLTAEIQRAKAYQALFNLHPRLLYGSLKQSARLWRVACTLIRGERTYVEVGARSTLLKAILNRLEG